MIIGISGGSGSSGNGVGKDEVGKIIQYLSMYPKSDGTTDGGEINRSYNSHLIDVGCGGNEGKWQIKKFAGKVNECYKIITGIDFHSLSREDKEGQRRVFIAFAEGVKKSLCKEIWCEALTDEYVQYSQDQAHSDSEFWPNWIITDVRFNYEFEAIKERGGVNILVLKDKLPKGLEGQQFDGVIENNGTIEELIDKVREFLIKKELI